jgi:hypothetical protein
MVKVKLPHPHLEPGRAPIGDLQKMRILFLAAAAALIAAPAFAAPDVAPAKEKAAPHYDCTKKGNANKAACKTAAATPMAAAPAAAPMAKPAPMMAAKPAPMMASKPAPAMAAGGSMKACAAQWHTLSDAQKADWKVKGAAMKSKKSGRPLNDYQAFSSECMKK